MCAGDMGTFRRFESTYQLLFALLAPRFRQVIVIPGNHTYYNSKGIWGGEDKFWHSHHLPENIAYADNEVVTVGDLVFLCSCLWTDFHHSDPRTMAKATYQINDFRLIYVEANDMVHQHLTLSAVENAFAGQSTKRAKLASIAALIRYSVASAYTGVYPSKSITMATVVRRIQNHHVNFVYTLRRISTTGAAIMEEAPNSG